MVNNYKLSNFKAKLFKKSITCVLYLKSIAQPTLRIFLVLVSIVLEEMEINDTFTLLNK